MPIRPSEDGHTNHQWGDIIGDPNPHYSTIPMLCSKISDRHSNHFITLAVGKTKTTAE